MFGLATTLQISFSMPMFSVWMVPERAVPLQCSFSFRASSMDDLVVTPMRTCRQAPKDITVGLSARATGNPRPIN